MSENLKHTRNRQLACAVGAVLAVTGLSGNALAAEPAAAKFYGQVAYNMRDLNSNKDIDFSRHAFSETRFGFTLSKELDNGLKVLALQEFGVAEGAGALATRRQSFGFSGGFGTVLLGQYNDVGDGTINADLAGTGVVDPLSSNSAGAVGIGVNGFDPGRGEALRYYTPKLGGMATIGVQLQENGESEIALKLNTKGFRFNAFAESRDPEEDKNGFLLGYKIAGFSATYVQSEDKQANLEHSGWKLGYGFGNHVFSVSQVTLDKNDGTDDDEATGLVYLYNMAKGVQLWVAHKDVDKAGTVNDDDGIAVGGLVKF